MSRHKPRQHLTEELTDNWRNIWYWNKFEDTVWHWNFLKTKYETINDTIVEVIMYNLPLKNLRKTNENGLKTLSFNDKDKIKDKVNSTRFDFLV